MNTYTTLIFLSGLVIFSYLFDLFAKRTRLPSVLLLLALGIGIRAVTDAWGYDFPQVALVLPTLGNIGLILIVFEGALELEYERSKHPLIRKAFASAFFLLLLTTAGIAAVLQYTTGAGWLICIANAVPLSVMSSAVAIPSASGLPGDRKEFVVYESSFSDILGIILFNFIVINTDFGAQAFGSLGLEILSVLALSAVFSLALLWLLGRIKHHVKFFLILAILVMVYALGKQLHLSSLVVVLVFGIFLANADQLPFAWFKRRFLYTDFYKDIEQFHSLSSESAFLIRTFFFVLFGYSVVVAEVVQRDVLLLGGALLAVTYVLRALFLKLAVRMELRPLLYITPRGLISILLYLSLPEHLHMPEVGLGLLFVLVLGSCLIMALGLLGARGLMRSLGELGG